MTAQLVLNLYSQPMRIHLADQWEPPILTNEKLKQMCPMSNKQYTSEQQTVYRWAAVLLNWQEKTRTESISRKQTIFNVAEFDVIHV
jgi:hypothetical protein